MAAVFVVRVPLECSYYLLIHIVQSITTEIDKDAFRGESCVVLARAMPSLSWHSGGANYPLRGVDRSVQTRDNYQVSNSDGESELIQCYTCALAPNAFMNLVGEEKEWIQLNFRLWRCRGKPKRTLRYSLRRAPTSGSCPRYTNVGIEKLI